MTLVDTPSTGVDDYAVYTALNGEAEQLRAEVAATADPAQRAELYRLAATNQSALADLWDAKPGRRRDKATTIAQYRNSALLCTAAAAIEQLRATAAEHGRELPDPMPLLKRIEIGYAGSEAALETLIALYTAAARTPEGGA